MTDNKKFKKKVKRKAKALKTGRSKKFVLFCFVSAIVVIVGVLGWGLISHRPDVGLYQPYMGDFTEDGSFVNGLFPEGIADDNGNIKRKDAFYNFLVVGCDKKGLNTDVIMTVSFDVKNNSLAIAQVPRDSYVKVSGSGRKINSVFSRGYLNAQKAIPRLLKSVKDLNDEKELEKVCKQAYEDSSIVVSPADLKDYGNKKIKLDVLCTKNGMELLRRTVNSTFGIVSDYYVFMDLEGFRNIVDIIGGVKIDVPSDMHYEDEFQDLYIHINKGLQTLDGEKAEQFIRFRSGYYNADIGRIDAQKLFMSAFLDKMISTSTVTKIPQLIEAVEKHVITTVSLKDASYFAMNALGLDLSNITMITMHGTPVDRNGSYYSLNKSANLKLVNEYFNVFNVDIPEEAVTVHELVAGKDTDVKVSTAEDIESGNFDAPISSTKEQQDKQDNESQEDLPEKAGDNQEQEDTKETDNNDKETNNEQDTSEAENPDNEEAVEKDGDDNSKENTGSIPPPPEEIEEDDSLTAKEDNNSLQEENKEESEDSLKTDKSDNSKNNS